MPFDSEDFLPSLPVYPTAPATPIVSNGFGDIQGQFEPHRYDPLQGYGPSQADIQAAVNRKEQENKRGAFWDLLAISDKLAGQAIKGAVRGAAEGGFAGAIEGFDRGTPIAFLSDWLFGTNLSRETTAVDIRRAFGDTSDQSGASNFFINLGIDAALDPISWLLTPFGKTAQGAAKALKAADAIKAAEAAATAAGTKLAPEAVYAIQDSFKTSASLAKAIDIGDKAAFVLKLPFAKAPFFESNLGFKSMSLGVGKAIDWTLGKVRAGPVGDLVRMVKVDYIKNADPEIAEAFSTAMKRGTLRGKEIVGMAANVLQHAGNDVLETVARVQAENPYTGMAMTTMAEADIMSLDSAAQLTELASTPDLLVRRQGFARAMATDPVFKNLYNKATSVRPDDIGFVASQKAGNLGVYEDAAQKAHDALFTLYQKYPEIPLPNEYLAAAQLPPRSGVEISGFREWLNPGSTAEEVAKAHPDSLSPGEKIRQQVASQTPNAEMEARKGALDKLKEGLDYLQNLDPEDKAKIGKYLETRKFLMQELARVGAVNGIMNATFEHYAGPYVMRVATDDTRNWIDSNVRSKIAGFGPAGTQVLERFMKNREFTGLLTIEANAIAFELGTKATGYTPLKEIAKAMEEHGADGVWAQIIDKPFIRDLFKRDPQAAEFFSTNLAHNDYTRVIAQARATGKMVMMKQLFDSVMKKTTSKLSDVVENQGYIAKGMTGVLEVGTPGIPFKEVSGADLVLRGMNTEQAATYEVAKYNVAKDFEARVRPDKANFEGEHAAVKAALDINPSLHDTDLAQVPGETYAASNMKGAAREVKDSTRRLSEVIDSQAEWERTIGNNPSKMLDQPRNVATYEAGLNELKSSSAAKKEVADRVYREPASNLYSPLSDHYPKPLETSQTSDAVRARLANYDRRYTDTIGKTNAAIDDQLSQLSNHIDGLDKAIVTNQNDIRIQTLAEQGRIKQQINTIKNGAKEGIDALRKDMEDLRARGLAEPTDKITDYPSYAKFKEGMKTAVAGRKAMLEDVGQAGAQKMAEAADPLIQRINAATDKMDQLAKFQATLSNKNEWVRGMLQLDREEAELGVKTSRETYDAVKQGIQEHIRQIGDTHRATQEMMRGAKADTNELLSAQRGSNSPSRFNQELKIVHRLRQNGHLALDEAHNTLLSDGSTLASKLPPDATVHWFDKDTWNSAIEQINEAYRPDYMRTSRVAQALDYVKSLWAPFTTVNPLFLNSRVRDYATNVLSLMKGGFTNWSSIPEAFQTRWALHQVAHGNADASLLDGIASQWKNADGTIGSITHRELIDRLQGAGTLNGQATMMSDLMDTTEAMMARRPPATAGGIAKAMVSAVVPIQPGMNSPVIRWGAKMAGALDDTSKIAGYLDALKRGMVHQQAVEHVAGTLYNGLFQSTALERSILQRVIPFYSYAKWAMGQSVDMYLKQPGILDMLGKVRDAAYVSPPFGGQSMDPAQVDTILPQFLKDGLGIPYKNTPEGPRFFALGGYLPVGEISQLVAGIQGMFDPQSKNGMLNYVASKMNPALKVPLEMFINRDTFTDREIEAIPGQQYNFMGMTLGGAAYQIAKQVRTVSELGRLGLLTRDQGKAIVQAQALGEEGSGVKPLGEREQLPFLERFIGSAFGFTPKTYLQDVVNDTRQARAANADEISKSRGMLRNFAIASEGSPAAAKNINALKTVLADQYADKALMNQELSQYGVKAREMDKALRQRDKTALNALRSRAAGE